ncbi:MAG: nucleoside deaminase [Caldilineaceae bacterium SB0662_bin_9]|uniref:Nucleoside deaminase n=1 Tax=Caldilineaceae bacterium SB0662_bin_9 TaxID=2605258 RepID=A0A6B1DNP3_9CHLR|nr:nucleoside deaminase [Caldilineaceae bacterium]MXZ40807.1 nucleoside deaminase [Caldilineaceae bacterium SB0666_bin_21]MYD89140.1 nucleoside deaminase [Caldilineaceae bacterium SB0662_bin_9]
MNHSHMRRAIELSRHAINTNLGGPFGAVVVRGDLVVAEGFNRVTSSLDPTAHAEVTAIRAACTALGTHQLTDCEIYTSCEPCPMCLGAIYWSGITRIYFANSREDAAAVGFSDQFLYEEIPLPVGQRTVPSVRLLGNEALRVFDEWRAKQDKIPY